LRNKETNLIKTRTEYTNEKINKLNAFNGNIGIRRIYQCVEKGASKKNNT